MVLSDERLRENRAFDILEAMAERFPGLGAYFSRSTGGIDAAGLVIAIDEAFGSALDGLSDALSRRAAEQQEPVAANDPHRFAVVSSDYFRPFLLGIYPAIENAVLAQCGSPDKWHIYERYAASPQPPQQQPVLVARNSAGEERAMLRLDEGWVIGDFAETVNGWLAADPTRVVGWRASPQPPVLPGVSEDWGDPDDFESVTHALDIAAMGGPYSDVQGNLYCNPRYSRDGYRDAEFRDYGLARAVRILCNNAKRIKAALLNGGSNGR